MTDAAPEGPPERRVYLNTSATMFAVVSEEDYQWAIRWCWQITWDRHKRKAYGTRSTTGPARKRRKLYLHKEILKRTGKVQPSEAHTIGDHGDGDTQNCQRANLEWATPSQNAINRRRRQ